MIAEIEGFAMRRIANPAKAADEDPSVSDVARRSAVQPIEIGEHPGVLPLEGARTLVRILLAETPNRIVVASRQIDESKQSDATAPAPTASSPVHSESVEETLAEWFQDLLGVENVELDDDFFNLGGHSLIAVRLFAKIKNAYQADLELATLFEARTVRALASIIRKTMQPAATITIGKKWSCLVPIQPNGSRVPFFFIHAIGGEVLFYEPLAKSLGPDQPFYALQSYLATHEEIRDTSIQDLASIYLEEIRSFFPQGPYILGGHSYGGLVAFEMAQQLRAQGVDPALLVMLDAVVPGSKQRIDKSAQLSMLQKNLRNEGLAYLTRKAGLKRVYWQRILRLRVQHAAASAYRLGGRRLPASLRYPQMEEVHARALERYKFKTYSGKIALIRAMERGYGGVVSISELDDPTLRVGSVRARWSGCT